MTPTKGPWWPKSVVMVMTPDGLLINVIALLLEAAE
jgi:hypothetical protein